MSRFPGKDQIGHNMARRVFNNAVLNGQVVAIKDFVGGSGEITVTGSDTQKVTDDHTLHNLRLNVHYEAEFKTFRKRLDVETNPRVNVFGGNQQFYLDTTLVAGFPGVGSVKYNKLDNTTDITIRGEAEDA